MGALFNRGCRSCNGSHELFLPGMADMLTIDQTYQYTCPETKESVRFDVPHRNDEDEQRSESARPPDAVLLTVVAK